MNIADSSQQLVVFDQLEECPYLPGRTARLRLRAPLRQLTPDQLDARLAAGDRRNGSLLYRATCPECQACQALRLPVAEFRPSRNQRRVLRRGDRAIKISVGRPQVDQRRVQLLNDHARLRGLEPEGGELDQEGYWAFLIDSCCDTYEVAYHHEGELLGAAICDRGRRGLSAVYCYWDPRKARLSPGVYSILKLVELCRGSGIEHLYLGYYIAESPHMRYKGEYLPHERLIAGTWRRFEGA